MKPIEKSSDNINLVRTVPTFSNKPEDVVQDRPVKNEIVDRPATEPPIEKFEHKNGHPYIVEKLGIADLVEKMQLKDPIKDIDMYVLKEIETKGLESSKKAYDSIVESMESTLQLDKNLSFDKKIEKLSAYARLMFEQNRIQKLKEEMINGKT